MTKVLILYSTVDGHTLRICRRLSDLLAANGHEASLTELTDATRVALDAFDKVVVGASIRYGRHRPAVADFLRANRATLQRKPTALFSVNIVARKPAKSAPDTNPYLRKLVREIGWRPARLEVFAGKLDYPRYAFWDRQVIRFIMLLTRGPTDPRAVVDYTDWRQVGRFAQTIAEMQSGH
jgi:menaquinone-dependent protoporphyrinogen oxidase